MPPPTAMKSLWQAAVACCAALKSAASRLSITIWRPLMPPEALHQSANALACWANSASSPGYNGVGGVVEHGDVDGLRSPRRAPRRHRRVPVRRSCRPPARRRWWGRSTTTSGWPIVAAEAVVEASDDVRSRRPSSLSPWPAAAPTFEARLVLCGTSSHLSPVYDRVIQSATRPERGSARRGEPRKMRRTGPSPAWYLPEFNFPSLRRGASALV